MQDGQDGPLDTLMYTGHSAQGGKSLGIEGEVPGVCPLDGAEHTHLF